ncbi:DUF167 domain-containing protein [filamentous cyanobacterium LEGE 11480]|uniref:DUF167 domain-containing protein n=1 Tax=Romeriopsis navalis LEGE 11480 TaxID=2777977 RepID=A0A928VL97_9CYAN|nr:DUF167 domain-containing protein [Romeriopsis navalis]MBE9028600.1 DUF167 domain-containing protein [Romeriopsis navalis LEGE 11480]
MILQIKVKPNAKQQALTQQEDGTWFASLKSPPVDGKANAELIKLRSKAFKVSKCDITIKTDAEAKLKLVEIDD